jgi:hypothetical protein
MGLVLGVILALQAPAAAQSLNNLMGKSGVSMPSTGGGVSQSAVNDLAGKVEKCSKLDTQGMIDCATALAPVAADLSSKAADSGMLGPQVQSISAAISSMMKGNRVPL